jgi:type I restriction enzyme S subunit
MSKKNINVPNLRFPEFAGEWKEKKLGEIADVSKLAGYEFTKYIIYEETGKVIALRGLNIKNNRLDLSDVKYIDNSNLSKLNRSKLFIDDLMFTYIGTIGEVALIEENDRFYLAPNVSRIRVDNSKVLPQFLLQYFNQPNFKNIEILKYISSSSQPALTMENVRKFTISFPSFQEQTRIAHLLHLIDVRVSTQSQIIKELETLITCISKKLFSQKLKFKDDYEKDYLDWEMRRLKDIVNIKMGQSPDSSSYNIENIGVPLIQGNADITDRKSNPRQYTSNPTKLCEIGDLLLTVRAPVGCIAKSLHNACIGRGICSIENNEYSLIEFIYQFLRYFENNWKSIEQGSTFTSVNSSDIGSISIKVPSINEQTKIANFLSAIDEKLETEKQILKKYTERKKYLLANMFI